MPVQQPTLADVSRRRWLATVAGAAAVVQLPVQVRAQAGLEPRAVGPGQHLPFGPVVPARSLGALTVTNHLGQSAPLATLLRGRVSALQFMFTGCRATCPIQGALFAQAQRQLTGVAGTQFVSISIDALGDTPAHLAEWLRRLDAKPGWWAAVPPVAGVDPLVTRLSEGGEPWPKGPDPHTGQVYIFNTRAELVLRTLSMPPAAGIVEAIRRVMAQG